MILTLKGKILAGAVEKITLFDGQFDTAFQIKSIVICPEDILTAEAVTVKLMTEEAAHNTDWFWAKNTEVGWASWNVPTNGHYSPSFLVMHSLLAQNGRTPNIFPILPNINESSPHIGHLDAIKIPPLSFVLLKFYECSRSL
jgi:hypothetical protein